MSSKEQKDRKQDIQVFVE